MKCFRVPYAKELEPNENMLQVAQRCICNTRNNVNELTKRVIKSPLREQRALYNIIFIADLTQVWKVLTFEEHGMNGS